MYINTSRMVLTVIGLVSIGFIWTTFYPNAPYAELVGSLVVLAGGLGAKRHVDKVKKVDHSSLSGIVSNGSDMGGGTERETGRRKLETEGAA